MTKLPSDWQTSRGDERAAMVARQIQARGVVSVRVLDAMRQVPRHCFVPEGLLSQAYADWSLPIGEGQTISQPYIVALMTELADPPADGSVLEIGTGSGYQAAVLAGLCRTGADPGRLAGPAQTGRAAGGAGGAGVRLADAGAHHAPG